MRLRLPAGPAAGLAIGDQQRAGCGGVFAVTGVHWRSGPPSLLVDAGCGRGKSPSHGSWSGRHAQRGRPSAGSLLPIPVFCLWRSVRRHLDANHARRADWSSIEFWERDGQANPAHHPQQSRCRLPVVFASGVMSNNRPHRPESSTSTFPAPAHAVARETGTIHGLSSGACGRSSSRWDHSEIGAMRDFWSGSDGRHDQPVPCVSSRVWRSGISRAHLVDIGLSKLPAAFGVSCSRSHRSRSGTCSMPTRPWSETFLGFAFSVFFGVLIAICISIHGCSNTPLYFSVGR